MGSAVRRRRGLAWAMVVVLASSLAAAPADAAPSRPEWPRPGQPRAVAGKAAGKAAPPNLAVDADVVKPRGPAKQLSVSGADAVDRDGSVFRSTKAGTVTVDYSGQSFGGDYASRLRLVDTGTGKVVPARNDVAAGKIQAEVAANTTYAVTAGPSGEAGSFAPTSLAPSATWAVGVQSGDFSWSYPIPVPPAPGLTPQVALAYTSGVVDGRTSATNNQVSWVGEGFSYEPGFIERSYKPCSEDGQPGKGDLCWDRQAAHLVLPGVTGELVWDAAKKVWRVADDEGWRVELRTGAGNGDNDGEHWLVTGPDGAQYSFGREAAAKSAWTVPVFGNNPDEPCNGPSFEVSWCQQAYRWTLDTVTTPHGDKVSYFYDTETNNYGRAGVAANATRYVRSGHLVRIEYGGARVVFTTAPRCVPGSACQAPGDWPDTPWDLDCGGGSCAATGPSFWSTKRLAKITTQVGGADVDSWTLTHVFPGTGDHTSPALWLRSIVHTGHVGGSAAMPQVLFDGVLMPNRIDRGDGLQPMNRWRLSRIYNETGGVTEVGYLNDRCAAGALPRPDTNAKKCFPAYWLPTGASTPDLGWFTKYVVGEVAETDRVTQAKRKLTRYEYVDTGPSWRYVADELLPSRFRTWESWRGFQKVRVRAGEPGRQTLTEYLFLRGMDDDLLLDGTRRDVRITDSQGREFEDKPTLAGFARETVVRDGGTGTEISAEFQQPWLSEPTAVRNRDTGPLEARILKVDSVQTRTALAGGGTRMSETRTKYDGYGSVTEVHDLGDVSVPDDDICTTTTYARNTTAWIVNLPNRVVTASVPCGTAVTPADTISDERTYYDGAGAVDAPPTKGDITRTEKLASWNGTTPVYADASRAVHDQHGRVVESYDALGARTTTAYQPPTGGPVTRTTVTNPLGHATVTELSVRGQALATVDPNGRREARAYDALGRLAAVWDAGRAVTTSPTVRYDYLIRSDAPSVVTTHRLRGDGGYITSHALYDGLLRQRQTQAPAPNGGRIVTDTQYDANGRVERTNAGYHNIDAPGTSLLLVNDADVPSQQVVEYDGAGRRSAEVLRSYGQEKQRTTFGYGGNWVSEDPPPGGTPTTRVTDVRGRVTELRQYTGDGPTGDYQATRYGYTKAGNRSSVTDAAGNVWRFGYDPRGRQVRVEDPDKGVATMTYDDKDRLATVTDARGGTLAYTYDALDRRTGVFEGSPNGHRLTEWTFDSLPGGVGEPVAAIRYVDGEAYRTETLGYDAQGRPTGTAVTIPAREGRLAGRYESTLDYNRVGQVVRAALPAAGGLPAETLTNGYNAVGLAGTLSSDLAQYVAETGYGDTGRLDYRILGGRVLHGYTYDESTNRRTGLRTLLETGDVAAEEVIGYDPAGNVVSSADTTNGDAQCFTNDTLGRLVEAWTTTNGCAAAPGLGGSAPYWHTYGYDKVGNRTREVGHSASGDTVRDFAYPAAGDTGPHRVHTVATGSRVDGYGYDAAGNTVSRPGQTMIWNTENRLSKVDESGKVTTFEYDADGERLIRRDPEGSTLYLGDTEVRAHAGTGAVTATRYYTVDGTTVGVRTESGLSWLADDHTGTGTVAIQADDLAVRVRRHLPYGVPRGETPPGWPGERGFVGGEVDRSTGLTHLGARDYDPGLGAFAQVDPILGAEDPQQLHGYAYAGNSPVTHADPSGLTPDQVTIVWDSAVTAFRAGTDPEPAKMYTVDLPDSGTVPWTPMDSWPTGSTTGWSPKVPPGYTTPPDLPDPVLSLPIPGTPTGDAPGPWTGRPLANDGLPYADPGPGDWSVHCQTSGLVRTCHYTPVRSTGGRPAVDDYQVNTDYFDYIYGDIEVEVRDYWEYDRCKPWNPCNTKPGMIAGYSPPGLYDTKRSKVVHAQSVKHISMPGKKRKK